MSAATLIAAAPGFTAPSKSEFDFDPFAGDISWLTKPLLLATLAALLVAVFYWSATRAASVVPNRVQFVGESFYNLIRNGIARDTIGAHDFARFVPYLVTLFSFILVNNVFGIIPLIQFPTMSRIGFPIALTAFTYLTYLYLGFRRLGVAGFFKETMFPPGVPWWVYPILSVIELVTMFVTRPLTLALRLFANMFAGHLLLLVFIIGGDYMLRTADATLLKVFSPVAFLLAILLTFFELLIEVLQAYIFTLLSALYIASALNEAH